MRNRTNTIIKITAAAATVVAMIVGGAGYSVARSRATHGNLLQARAGFHTRLIAYKRTPDIVQRPPNDEFNLVYYTSPVGKLPAYVSIPPTSGKRYPAIVWIFGGFDNSIGDTAWTPQSPDNDQSASVFRRSGIVTMYPALRGGNRSAGYIENFYGEVNDVLAAANYLAHQPFVDPHRIYLGGHSTGGTLALLTAESTSRFRAVFSFGPVSRVTQYGTDELTFNYADPREVKLRSPIYFLQSITKPTIVMEGTGSPNITCLNEMNAINHNTRVHFYTLPGYDHFSELAVSTPMVAQWILRDTGPVFTLPRR